MARNVHLILYLGLHLQNFEHPWYTPYQDNHLWFFWELWLLWADRVNPLSSSADQVWPIYMQTAHYMQSVTGGSAKKGQPSFRVS